jgi:hypothetical protein
MRLIYIGVFFTLCSCVSSSPFGPASQDRSPSATTKDVYKENNLTRDQMYQELVQRGRLEHVEEYSVIGLFEKSNEALQLYTQGKRVQDLDFAYQGQLPGLTSYWTTRFNQQFTCFKLSHVSPKIASAIGPSNFWCIYPR